MKQQSDYSDIARQILILMQQDAEAGIRERIHSYESHIQTFQDLRRQNINKILRDATSFIKIVWQKDFFKSFQEKLNRELQQTKNDITDWISGYYNERITVLAELMQEIDKQAMFPELPLVWINYATSWSAPKPISESDVRDIYARIVSKIWINHADFASLFPKLIAVESLPAGFTDTLLKQTVKLWGKSPMEVFESRMNLYLQKVLEPALETAGQELKDFGSDQLWWNDNCVSLGELLDRILKAPALTSYRKIQKDVVTALDEQASHLPRYARPEHIKREFSDSAEIFREMRCSFVEGRKFPERFMNVLKTELGNIKNYYQHIARTNKR